jgi:hypothetical protein
MRRTLRVGNALETLRKVAKAVTVNSIASWVSGNIMQYFFRDHCIEESMLAILDVVTDEERGEMADVCYEERLWCEKVAAVMVFARVRKDHGKPEKILFEGLQEVLDAVGYRDDKEAADRVEGVGSGYEGEDEGKHNAELRAS